MGNNDLCFLFENFTGSWCSNQKTNVGKFVAVLRLHFSVYDVCTTELVIGLLMFLRCAQLFSIYDLLGF